MLSDRQWLSPFDGDATVSKAGSKTGKTLVVVATYNEIENLPNLVDEIFRYLPAADLLVVDDNSPDGTGSWCDAKAAADPRVRCLHREGKMGLGSAIIAAMKYALAEGYTNVLTMDADFSHPPKCLPAMVAGMDRKDPPVDVMIGSRYVPGGGVEGWPLKRHFMSRGVNFYARWLLGLQPRDCSGNYRCYRTSILSKLDFDNIRSRGYSIQEEILWCLKRVGARFGETPIVFVDRQRGTSKINGKEAISAMRIIFSLGMQSLFGL
jgi:dolichol-phosphate mannosyltransferase